MIILTFPGLRPCAKARPRVTSNGTYMPQAYMDWKHVMGWIALNEFHRSGWPLVYPMAVGITYRTQSGNMRPDVDNAAGAVLDALQDAGVIANDGQVRRLVVEVIKAKKAECGITVTIEAIPSAPEKPHKRA